MKKFMMLLMVVSLPCFAGDWVVPIRYVYDGDTIMVRVKELPEPLNDMSVRIRGIDTPEMRGKCEKERKLAHEAAEYLENLISMSPTITMKNYDWDKYGGRIDADVYVNDINLGKEMVKAGFARPYLSGQRAGWCE